MKEIRDFLLFNKTKNLWIKKGFKTYYFFYPKYKNKRYTDNIEDAESNKDYRLIEHLSIKLSKMTNDHIVIKRKENWK